MTTHSVKERESFRHAAIRRIVIDVSISIGSVFLVGRFLHLSGLTIIGVAGIAATVVSIASAVALVTRELLHQDIASRRLIDTAKRQQELAENDAKLWKQTLLERNKAFPSLLHRIAELDALRDAASADSLRKKKHPALKSAAVVAEESRRRREAELRARRAEALVELYETYAPFLVDIKDDIPDEADPVVLEDYTDEERADATTQFLTKQEYRSLNSRERNQLALDRYWRRPKSNWHIGKMYERYIGYLYEQKGYMVEYFGIANRYEDLGRDLVCRKDNHTLIVQCKRWSQFRTIYEKHIYQLFGTTFEYRERCPNEVVTAVLVTSTQLSPVARKIAHALDVKLQESKLFDETYPCIKCNINRQAGTRIYHLPFDQMYDGTVVNQPGEFYCRTVAEAEDAGFRRAFRWRGSRES